MPGPTRTFGELRLRGGRYEDLGFPVETLPELARYERLILDVAKGLWKQDNPSRQRIPRGFANRLQLRLMRVDGGSVQPILERPVEPNLFADDDSVGVDDFFEEARVIIENAISAIAARRDLPTRLPASAHSSFTQFGASLRDNERIEFMKDQQVVAVYNNAVRRSFLSQVSSERFPVEGAVVGRITELNPEAKSFTFTSIQAVQIPGHYSDSALVSDFVAVLQERALAPVVRLDGQLVLTSNEDVVDIQDVRSLELFDQDDEPWSNRMVDLLSLRPKWDGDCARQVSVTAIEYSREILRQTTAAGRPEPGIFPTPGGGVQLEWQTSSLIASVEVSADLDDIDLYCLYLEDKSDIEESAGNINQAVNFLLGLL